MTKTEKLNKLFLEWKKTKSIYHTDFARDGIIDEELWNKAEPKVLFLLKEPNKPTDDLRDLIREGGGPWPNLRYWNYALQSIKSHSVPPDFREAVEAKENSNDSCNGIAIVNLKKSSGGYPADDKKIELFAKDDKKDMEEEIHIIAPDIIVCGGTWKFCNQIWNNQSRLSENVYRIPDFESIIWIKFYHPVQQFRKPDKLYSVFLDIIKNIS